jgi:hypothetical protein
MHAETLAGWKHLQSRTARCAGSNATLPELVVHGPHSSATSTGKGHQANSLPHKPPTSALHCGTCQCDPSRATPAARTLCKLQQQPAAALAANPIPHTLLPSHCTPASQSTAPQHHSTTILPRTVNSRMNHRQPLQLQHLDSCSCAAITVQPLLCSIAAPAARPHATCAHAASPLPLPARCRSTCCSQSPASPWPATRAALQHRSPCRCC